MAVVGSQILKEFGPNARIPARRRIQAPSFYQVRKDTDVPVAFSNGHLGDTDAAHIREVSLLARSRDMALKQAPGPGVRDAQDLGGFLDWHLPHEHQSKGLELLAESPGLTFPRRADSPSVVAAITPSAR